MKFNRIFIAGIFLLAILSIAPLCASDENAHDNLLNQVDDSISESGVLQDDIIEDSEDADEDIDYEDDFYDYEDEDDDDDEYDGDYDDYEDEEEQTITINIKASAPSTMYTDTATQVTFKGPKDYWGDIFVTVDGKKFRGEYENGKAVVKIKAVTPGTKNISYVYEDGLGDPVTAKGTFTTKVLAKPIIKADSMSMFSNENKYYKVRILKPDGKPMGAGESVTFYLNNKKLQTVKTDKNGYAKVKISKNPGTYKIKTAYKTLSVSKTLKVKYVLKPLKKTSGKNLNKLTLKVDTNKVNGKYLTGQSVSFKLYGKTYKAKIDKKGVAKVTLKQSEFAKVKVKNLYLLKVTFGKESRTMWFTFTKIKPKMSYLMGMDAFYATG